jgi:hypothetical protein
MYNQLQLSLALRTIRCPRRASGELPTLRNRRSRMAIIHWTVRWCTGLSGGAPDCPVSHPRRTRRSREKEKGDVAIIHRTVWWCTGLFGEPIALVPTVVRVIARNTWLLQRSAGCTVLSGVHRTVSGAPTDSEKQRSTVPDLEGNHEPDMLQWLSGGAPDCPVRHSTEGKDSLPCWSPTAASCLGAIKGTHRRMEQAPKHSLSILRHPDFAPTHLLRRVSDLSSIRVVNSPCCHLSSSLHLCACVCCGLNLVCVAFPSLTSMFLL